VFRTKDIFASSLDFILFKRIYGPTETHQHPTVAAVCQSPSAAGCSAPPLTVQYPCWASWEDAKRDYCPSFADSAYCSSL